MWQDKVIGLACLVFVYALIPQIWKSFKEKRSGVAVQTSALTGGACLTLSVCMVTAGLVWGGVMNGLVGCLWLTVLAQRFYYGK